MSSINHLAAAYAESFSAQSFDKEPHSLYQPIEHILSIPGKRIRPLLLLVSCSAFSDNIPEALYAAHAMELFHNFSLVHDDIMDAATLRRGAATVHEKFGLNAGIMAGDALLIYAYQYLCKMDPVHLPAALHAFNKTAVEIMEGQQTDMDFEQRLDVSIEEYLQMIAYKTSVLLGCSLQIGAIIGGAPVEDQQRLYDFGRKLGLSFQIKDDWLDTFGESEKVGKKVGGDIIQNKKTYLLITLLNEATDDDRKKLGLLLNEKDEDKKVKGIKALYDNYGISEKTSRKADSLYKEAIASLEAVNIAAEKKANLFALAEMVHSREF
jgi:geranylgeranyl diphosphate synthase type II